MRPPLCTCTLIAGDSFRMLVDPSIEDGKRMEAELNRRTGLWPDDINMVFITHAHGDHHTGLKNFPDATWLAGPEVAVAINASAKYHKVVQPITVQIGETVGMIHTPGHTMDHRSLRFHCDDLAIVIAGDAVISRDFWLDHGSYFNSVDPDLSARTMDKLAGMADIIVPGHDNYFLARLGAKGKRLIGTIEQ